LNWQRFLDNDQTIALEMKKNPTKVGSYCTGTLFNCLCQKRQCSTHFIRLSAPDLDRLLSATILPVDLSWKPSQQAP